MKIFAPLPVASEGVWEKDLLSPSPLAIQSTLDPIDGKEREVRASPSPS